MTSTSSRPRTRPRLSNLVEVLGCPVTIADRTELTRLIHELQAASIEGQPCQHLVTLNPEYVMLARRNPDLQAALGRASWSTADGIGIVLAAHFLEPNGSTVRRVTGVESVDVIAEAAAAQGQTVFLLGGAPGVAKRAARHLVGEHPGLKIAGVWDGGSPHPRHDDETLRRARDSHARFLLVAYGAPGQVTLIDRLRHELGGAGILLAVGIGGTLDFRAGVVRRAPRLIRQAGAEWLFRLVIEPWRWRRQLQLPVFAALVLVSGARQRLRKGFR